MLSITGIAYFLLVTTVAYIGSVNVLPLAWVCALFWYTGARKVSRFVSLWFFGQGHVLMSYMLGIQLEVHGAALPIDGNVLVMSNHRTRLDWMFLWMYFGFSKVNDKLKIILKYPLKFVPFYGWACQLFGFGFLARAWETDKEHVVRYCRYLTTLEAPYQLLIFPEGTDLSENNRAKSHKFAKDNGLAIYNQVLHPRTKGTIAFLQHTRSNLKAVADLTLAYTPTIPQDGDAIFKGAWPGKVHVHADVFDPASIPTNEEAIDEWVRDRFAKKEARLAHFYTHGTWPDEPNAVIRSSGPAPRELAIALGQTFGLFACTIAAFTWWPLWTTLYTVGVSLAYVVFSKGRGVDGLMMSHTPAADSSKAQ